MGRQLTKRQMHGTYSEVLFTILRQVAGMTILVSSGMRSVLLRRAELGIHGTDLDLEEVLSPRTQFIKLGSCW